MTGQIYASLESARSTQKKKFAVLIDPDKKKIKDIEALCNSAREGGVDYFFIGGSLIVNDMLDYVLQTIKSSCDIPLVLFPGNSFKLSYRADALLFLSLISGRNSDLLIGKHAITAPFIKISPLEIIPTGYMLIDGGIMTSVQYMSNTSPIPSDKNDIALCTAMAGEMLGLKLINMDAGSGAKKPISNDMIQAVRQAIQIPLIVGGGIKTPEIAIEKLKSGADLVVVGNAIEKNTSLIQEISEAVHSVY